MRFLPVATGPRLADATPFPVRPPRFLPSIAVPGTSVIGLQWGDEAKGKLVDLLAPHFDWVVRYQGGANAGHTVVAGDETYKLHHIPSGILHEGVRNVIGPGVVMNPATMIDEIHGLTDRGVDVRSRMRISERTHMVMPWHIAEDRLVNATKVGGESIGTTGRGIGPCYRDKVGRTHAVRAADLVDPGRDERLTNIARQKITTLKALGADDESLRDVAPERVTELAAAWADELSPMIGDTTYDLLDAAEADQKILFEGAQGALLDIDHGTFPFVTSSNSSGVGITAGSGLPPRHVNHVLGVCKAYSTRVGGGPFPTELDDEIGERIRTLGNEFGTTTGRPRRCGWFDAVAVRYTARLSGVDRIALMMMDVLAHLDELKVCVAYEIDGERTDRMPSGAEQLRRCVPVYETIPGWKQPLDDARSMDDFPAGAMDYVRRIEELIGIPVAVLSVGPDREQTIPTPAADALDLRLGVQPVG